MPSVVVLGVVTSTPIDNCAAAEPDAVENGQAVTELGAAEVTTLEDSAPELESGHRPVLAQGAGEWEIPERAPVAVARLGLLLLGE